MKVLSATILAALATSTFAVKVEKVNLERKRADRELRKGSSKGKSVEKACFPAARDAGYNYLHELLLSGVCTLSPVVDPASAPFPGYYNYACAVAGGVPVVSYVSAFPVIDGGVPMACCPMCEVDVTDVVQTCVQIDNGAPLNCPANSLAIWYPDGTGTYDSWCCDAPMILPPPPPAP